MQSEHLQHVQHPGQVVPGAHSSSIRQIVRLPIAQQDRNGISAAAIEAARGLNATIDQDAPSFGNAGAEILLRHLPQDTIAAIGELGRPSETSAIILSGVADLPAPPTPTSGLADDHDMKAHDLILAGAMKLAGTTPVAFPFENSGLIPRNVVANPVQRGKASSHGFDTNLHIHQDNCGQSFEDEILPDNAFPPMPRQLAFYAIRNQEEVPTRVLLVDDLLAHIQPRWLTILQENHYRIGAPDSVKTDGYGNICIENAPILRLHDGFHEMRYDPLLVTTRNAVAMTAHAHLAVAAEAAAYCAIDVNLKPGDIFIFKNYRLLHMRNAFEPAEAPRSRWLRRFYGRGLTRNEG